MGDQHNLFGRVNEVHVFLDTEEESGFYVEEVVKGSNIEQVLINTQYDSNDLIRKYKGMVDSAIRNQSIKATVGMKMLDEYKKVLGEYTYLSANNSNVSMLLEIAQSNPNNQNNNGNGNK